MAALVQIISIPVLISAWGAEKYGLWAMLTTIPTYFALTDLGFVQAATSDMTMETARGNREKANATFQSIWLMFLGVGGCVIFLTGILLFILPEYILSAGNWLNGYSSIIFLIVIFSALTLISRVTVAGFRASGFYAKGTLCFDSLVFIETILMLCSAWIGGNFEVALYTLIIVRIASMIALYIILRRTVPWLYYGKDHASYAELKRLFKPAIGAMAIPVALAINIQGMVLIIGTMVSPLAVAIYTPVRTASRLLIQVIGVVNRATMPEIATSHARNDRENMARIMTINTRLMMLVLVPGGLIFAIFGSDVVSIWTRGNIVPETAFVSLMATAMVLHGLWYFYANIVMATNSHTIFSTKILLFSIVCMFISIPLTKFYEIKGAALSLILSELLCLSGLIPYILSARFKKK